MRELVDSQMIKQLGERVAGPSHPYLACTLDGTIVSWSRTAAELLDLPEGRLLGMSCEEMVKGGIGNPLARRPEVHMQDLTLRDESGDPVGILHLLDRVEVVPGLFLG